jgi:hypothetical protein
MESNAKHPAIDLALELYGPEMPRGDFIESVIVIDIAVRNNLVTFRSPEGSTVVPKA